MKTVLLSDLHGNEAALRCVLRALEGQSVDQYVFLGDALLFGPQPHEALALLQTLPNLTCILGNTDVWFYNPPQLDENSSPDERWRLDLIRQGTALLDPAQVVFLRGFQPSAEIDLGGGLRMLAYHGTPGSASQQLLAFTPEAEVEVMFTGQTAPVCAGGHTHIQMLRKHGEKTLLNPGSVGLPLKRPTSGLRPLRAEFAILSTHAGELDISLRSIAVERHWLDDAAAHSGLPAARAWLEQWEIS